jgi:hypothetical protein
LRLLPVAVVVMLGAIGRDSLAATLTEPLQPGDIIFSTNNANSYTHIRNGTRIGAGPINYGPGTGNERLGGVFSDSTGAIYFAGQPGGANIPFPDKIIERIGVGQTSSSVIITTPELIGGPTLREAVIAPSGNIYALYVRDLQATPNTVGQGTIDKFTPNPGGGYTRSTVGVLPNFVGNDRGNGHQLSLTAGESYILASARDANSVWSMNTGTGVTQQWTVPNPLIGPQSGVQVRPSAQSVLDPLRPNRLLVPMGNDGLYEVDFDPATGMFPTAQPRRLTNDTVAAFIDAMAFDAANNLIVSTRDDATLGSLRMFTEAELAAASSGTTFSIFGHTPLYTGTDARIARDMAIAIPEPATGALVTLACLGLLARRHRRA